MAIEIRPSGEAQAVAQAGRVVGAGERAKEERARAEREQQRALEMQARDAARAWELQKLILNSQQDFAHEQRMRQAQLDAEARAREWEVEKMELASRFDFEQDEKERLRENATFDAGIKTIYEDETHDDDWKDRAAFRLALKHPDAKGAPKYLGLAKETSKSELAGILREILGGTTPPPEDTTTPPPSATDVPVVRPGYVLVKDKRGEYMQIPEDKVEDAISDPTSGFTLVDETQLFREAMEEERRKKEQHRQTQIDYLTNLSANIRF